MSAPLDLTAARRRAVARRALGVAVDFDPTRLALARRLAGVPRTRLARAVGVTAAAVTQYEKGQSRPALPVVDALAATLEVSVDFFRAGHPVPRLEADGAYFRSLRSTTALERDRALAFAELVLAVFAGVEQYVDLPPPRLPDLDLPSPLVLDDVVALAREARQRMNVAAGPVPNMARLLEAHGVAVVRLDADVAGVDAFCQQQGHRPVVLLSTANQDKARSRFDAAHELGHLLMHHDNEPGSRLLEQQAHAFAAEFLTPAAEIGTELPVRVDWVVLHALKRRWGVSLKALVFRARALGRFTDGAYQRALRQLSSWGLPEPGSLGNAETPVLFARAVALLDDEGLTRVADDLNLPPAAVERVRRAAGGRDERPAVELTVSGERPRSTHVGLQR